MSNLLKNSWSFPIYGNFDHWMNQWNNFNPVLQPITAVPPINILEGIMHFDFEMALPGIAKDNIKIVVDNQNVLTISTESKNEQMDDKKGDWKRREFSYQAFSRSLPLPANVDLIHITAAYENGVLKIHLPKISGPSAEVVQKIAVS